jgi:precorrin-2 dehydrogenase/sirohydrochlorin ferrochelatase
LNFPNLRDNHLFYHIFFEKGCYVKYYPVYLDVSEKRCVVVGGGDVAERKVMKLLECGAEVIVVSSVVAPGLAAMIEGNIIDHIPDDYDSRHIQGAFIVVGATDRDEVNEKIYRDSQDMGILVNIVDDPKRCDFIVPSIVRTGDLAIAISTGGKSPIVARKLREELEKTYGPEYGILLDIMGILREKMINRGESPEDNKDVFESVFDSGIITNIRKEEWGRVKETLYDLTREEVDVDAIVADK